MTEKFVAYCNQCGVIGSVLIDGEDARVAWQKRTIFEGAVVIPHRRDTARITEFGSLKNHGVRVVPDSVAKTWGKT